MNNMETDWSERFGELFVETLSERLGEGSYERHVFLVGKGGV